MSCEGSCWREAPARVLFPLTKVTNKHLLPVGREPMIFHPVRKLVQAGIREVLIVSQSPTVHVWWASWKKPK